MTTNYTPLQTPKNLDAFRSLLELEEKERTAKVRQGYIFAYFWSVCLPPLGVYFFFKYLFYSNGTKEDVRAGTVSLFLTIASLLFSIWLFDFVMKQMSVISPQSGEMLKELITPGNSSSLQQLLQ